MVFEILNALPLIIVGCIFGIFFGAMPGLTSTAAVTLLLPFVYNMNPIDGMGLLLGAFCGGISGGSIPAALLNIPGTPSSLCTTFDAYPLTKKGKAGKALGVALFASFWGGIIGSMLLFIIAFPIASLAIEFGPIEYTLLILIGLILIVRMEDRNCLKSAFILCLGMFCSLVGTDNVTGVQRLTFGIMELSSGINILPFLIGVFAISQVLYDLNRHNQTNNIESFDIHSVSYIKFPSLKQIKSNIGLLSISGIIGFLIGMLPGIGGSMASIMAYFTAKRISRNREEFGKGSIEGIMSSEASNNAMTGGALLTTLTLSVPGEACTAVIMGGLTLLGIRTGTSLFELHLDLLYGICFTFVIANFCMFILQRIGMNLFLKLLLLPKNIINPSIMVFSTLGVYCSTYNVFDVYLMVFFGVLGYLLKSNNFNIVPMVMGFILCPLLEKYIRLSISLYDSPLDYISRPLPFIFLSIISILTFSFKYKRNQHD